MTLAGGEGTDKRPETLIMALRGLAARLEAIDGVAETMIVSRDGLLVAGSGENADRKDVRAAVAAAMFGAVDRAGGHMALGPIRATLMETSTHTLQILNLSDLLFVVIATKGASLARIRSGLAEGAEVVARQLALR